MIYLFLQEPELEENDIKTFLQSNENLESNEKDKEMTKQQRDLFFIMFNKPAFQPVEKEIPTELLEPEEVEEVFKPETNIEEIFKKHDQFYCYLFNYLLKEMTCLELEIASRFKKEKDPIQSEENIELLNVKEELAKVTMTHENLLEFLVKLQTDMRENMKSIRAKLDEIIDPLQPLKNKINSMSEKLEKIEKMDKTKSENQFESFYLDDNDMIF